MSKSVIEFENSGKNPKGPTKGSLRRTQTSSQKLSKPAPPTEGDRCLVSGGSRLKIRMGIFFSHLSRL